MMVNSEILLYFRRLSCFSNQLCKCLCRISQAQNLGLLIFKPLYVFQLLIASFILDLIKNLLIIFITEPSFSINKLFDICHFVQIRLRSQITYCVFRQSVTNDIRFLLNLNFWQLVVFINIIRIIAQGAPAIFILPVSRKLFFCVLTKQVRIVFLLSRILLIDINK